MRIPLLMSLVLLVAIANGQNKAAFSLQKEKAFQALVAVESWAVYSSCEGGSTTNHSTMRSDVMFRRLRFGANGQPYSWLKYNFQMHMDHFGEDVYTAVKGKDNGIGIWNAFLTARLLSNSELLHLHIGYLWSAISREYNTSPWSVASLDKTRANWVLRHFITGKGSGIESGVAIGGIQHFNKAALSYRMGIYEPQAYACSSYANKLYTGRLMFSVGDIEQKTYSYMLKNNSRNTKSYSLTVGAGFSYQKNGCVNDSTYFDQSYAMGLDIRCQAKHLVLEGEYFVMQRNSNTLVDFDGYEYHARVIYAFDFKKLPFEVNLAYDKYNGEGSKVLYQYIGYDETKDMGVNCFLNGNKLKVGLHYIIQDGNISNTGDYGALALQMII